MKKVLTLDGDAFKAVWRDGAECKISSCFDAYEIDETDINVTSLARYDGGEFDGLSVVVQRKLGKGRVILAGSVIGKLDLLRLVNRAPIADASDNVILTERTGKSVGGMIACEVENKRGRVVLCGEYTDVITGRKLSGKTEMSPYEALVLVKNK